MKNIIRLITGSVALMLAAACTTDTTITEKFDPSVENPQEAYFQISRVSKAYAAGTEGDDVVEVKIFRQNAEGDAEIGLNYTIGDEALEDGILELPDNVSFKDGEYETSFPVKVYGIENFGLGKTYSATVTIGDHHDFEDVLSEQTKLDKNAPKTRVEAGITTYTTLSLSFTLELDWKQWYVLKDPSELLNVNEYSDATADHFKTDDKGNPIAQTAIFTDWWEENDTEVTIQRAAGTNVFRMYGYQAEETVNIIFSVTDAEVSGYKVVSLADQFSGYYYQSSSEIHITDLVSYAGWTPAQAPCYWDGENTFYFTLYWWVPDLGGGFSSYGSVSDVLEFSTGIHEPAPAVSIKYNGVEVDEMDITTTSMTFTPNSDVTNYYVTLLYGNFDGYDEDLQKEVEEAFIEAAKAGKTSFTRAYHTFPILSLEKADTRNWKIEEMGYYTAMAYSVYEDKNGTTVEGFDYDAFYADPDGGEYSVFVDIYVGDADDYYNDNYGWGPEYGMLPCNSIYLFVAAYEAEDPITAVRFAAVTAEEYNSASYVGNKAYLAANGTSWGSSDIAAANQYGQDDFIGGLEPDTEYVVLIEVSSKNGTRIYEEFTATSPVGDYTPLEVYAAAMTSSSGSYFSHSNIIAQFVVGTYEQDGFEQGAVVDGYYTAAAVVAGENGSKTFSSETWSKLLDVKDGKAVLKSGVTADDLYKALADNGTHFSTTDLNYLNYTGMSQAKNVVSTSPEREIMVMAFAEYPDGKKSWDSASATTTAAPAAPFTQTATAANGNLQFSWVGEAQFSKQLIQSVVYALVTEEELTAAGVSTAKLADDNLNGKTADKENTAAVEALLKAQGKTFAEDRAYYSINDGGYNGRFTGLASGTYYLVAKAYTGDQYVTKLTVAKVQL